MIVLVFQDGGHEWISKRMEFKPATLLDKKVVSLFYGTRAECNRFLDTIK